MAADSGVGTHSLLGTHQDMSPEQKRGAEATPASDVYALGVMMYRLLTGRTSVGMDRLSECVDRLGLWWDGFVRRALREGTGDRHADAGGMLSALGSPGEAGRGPQEASAVASNRSAAAPSGDRPEDVPRCAGTPKPGAFWLVPDLGMELVYVEEGSFDMGSDDADALDDEKPVHRVEISRGFWLGRYPVTQGEYQSLMGSNPSLFQAEVVVRKGFLGSGRQVKKRSLPRHPVEEVCWEDAVAFCRKLTDRERAAGRLPSGYGYRLPTEAEWEYAARGGSHSRGYVHAGSDMIGDVGWHAGNSGDSLLDDSMLDGLAKVEGEEMEVEERHAFLRDFLDVLRRNRNRTHAVGGRCPNELGLHDMSGNVWEWCADWYGEYSAAPVTDPEGPRSGSGRVGRGGAWYNSARACRVTDRGGDPPGFTDSCLGFRVSLAPATR